MNNSRTTSEAQEGAEVRLSRLGRSALYYAKEFGWAVLPLHEPVQVGADIRCSCDRSECIEKKGIGKHPRTKNGVRDATTDPSRITDWWTQYPNANIGVATGAVSGIFVLDQDDRNGGDEGKEKLHDQYGLLPDTVQAQTGGGWHFYFAIPPAAGWIRNSSSKLARGLDEKGEGGYVVAPPSVHYTGRKYGWEHSSRPDDMAPALPPPWLLGLVQMKPVEQAVGQPRDTGAPERIAQGQRNSTLASIAGRLRKVGFDEVEMVPALQALNASRCAPFLPDAEVEQIARSVARYPVGKDNALAPPEVPGWKTAEDWLKVLGTSATRFPTGIPTLDAMTAGGPREGDVVVIGGAPEANKTMLAVQLAHTFINRGHPVGFLAADEEVERVIIRIGQLNGLDRAKLEHRHGRELGKLADVLAGLGPDLLLANGDDPGGTLELVAEELAIRADGRPAVLVADSLQIVRTNGTERAENAKLRADMVMTVARAIAKRKKMLVVLTSELSRVNYKKPKNPADDMAAFKESGGVEYAAQLALVLRRSASEPDIVTVSGPKNKPGGRAFSFGLRLDRSRAELTEEPGSVNETQARPDDTWSDDLARVRSVLAALPDGVNGVEALARAAHIGKAKVKRAITELGIVNKGSSRRPVFSLPQARSGGARDALPNATAAQQGDPA